MVSQSAFQEIGLNTAVLSVDVIYDVKAEACAGSEVVAGSQGKDLDAREDILINRRGRGVPSLFFITDRTVGRKTSESRRHTCTFF